MEAEVIQMTGAVGVVGRGQVDCFLAVLDGLREVCQIPFSFISSAEMDAEVIQMTGAVGVVGRGQVGLLLGCARWLARGLPDSLLFHIEC